MIVSLNFDAGIRKDEFGQIILRYYHENQTHSFRNFFDVRKELITDIHHRINSNEKTQLSHYLLNGFLLGANHSIPMS